MTSYKSAHEHQDTEVLEIISELLALDSLDAILQAVVRVTPKLLNGHDCSIYLIRPLVKQYDGRLIDSGGKRINESDIEGEFIVLAAARRHTPLSSKIGKYFYRSGEGLVGWVFKAGQPLQLKGLDDERELRRYEGARRINKYEGAKSYHRSNNDGPKPLLALPLIVDEKCYGVVRVGASQCRGSFSRGTRQAFQSFGHVISQRIKLDTIIQKQNRSIREQKQSIRKQGRSIERLIQIGSISAGHKQQSFKPILDEVLEVSGASVCCLYLPDRYGEAVELAAPPSSDARLRAGIATSLPKKFRRGEGLTGWIFNTGRPLLINDTEQFLEKRRLKVQELKQHTGSALLNSDDRAIQAQEHEISCNRIKFQHFMGAPLHTTDGWTRGVLIALAKTGGRAFKQHDLRLLEGIAAGITKLIDTFEQQQLNKVLIKLGQEHGPELFQYVVNQIPALVSARGCSIFIKSAEGKFKLEYTSSPKLIDPSTKKPVLLEYEPGVGKTGLVAELGRSLVINHYGTGNLDRRKMQKEYQRYITSEEYRETNLVGFLKDERGTNVGLIRVVRTNPDEPNFSGRDRKIFQRFVEHTVFRENGLTPSSADNLCEEGEGMFTKSFLACPLRDRRGNIFGILRIPGISPGSVLTDESLALTASVCNRLSAVIEKENILEQNLNILSEITSKINAHFDSQKPDKILDAILEGVTNTLGFEFATIQLVNQDDNTIYTYRGAFNKKIRQAKDPQRWLKKARHPVDPPAGVQRDIHAWVLREHRKPIVIKGWHPHLDKEIYNEYGHKNLVRAFIPIVDRNPYKPSSGDKIIGTIEAGHNIRRKKTIEGHEIKILTALAEEAVIALKNRSLHEELIKADMLRLIPFMSHILKAPAFMLNRQLQEIMKALAHETPDVVRVKELIDWAHRSTLTIYSLSLTLDAQMSSREDLQKIREVEQVDLVDATKSLINIFAPEHIPPREGDIRINLHDHWRFKHLPLTDWEKSWFEVIVLNFLLNARKYSPPGGVIKVVCTYDEVTDDKLINVIDEGPGISAKVLPRLFSPRVHEIAKGWPEGSGHGLYTVKGLAEKLGWRCEGGNNAGVGATFKLRIPKEWRSTDE